MNEIDIDKIDFEKGDGLVPAIIQDQLSRQVLMLGYMNREALEITISTGRITFFSRSKQRLWTKGEISKNYLEYMGMQMDCDKDTLLFQVHPTGPVCHTGKHTCFTDRKEFPSYIHELSKIIKESKIKDPRQSYTAKLFKKGINKIAQKFGEEAVELIIESKDQEEKLFVEEAADMMYHFLVLLEYKQIELSTIEKELARRHRQKSKAKNGK